MLEEWGYIPCRRVFGNQVCHVHEEVRRARALYQGEERAHTAPFLEEVHQLVEVLKSAAERRCSRHFSQERAGIFSLPGDVGDVGRGASSSGFALLAALFVSSLLAALFVSSGGSTGLSP